MQHTPKPSKGRPDERSAPVCSKDQVAHLRRNPRRKKRSGPIPFSNLMAEARISSRYERAALAVIARMGGTVYDFAGGLLVVPPEEIEEQLDLLRVLATYEELRGCGPPLSVEFNRNPDDPLADSESADEAGHDDEDQEHDDSDDGDDEQEDEED